MRKALLIVSVAVFGLSFGGGVGAVSSRPYRARNKCMTKSITNIIISAMLMLSLSHCDNRQQTKQTEEEKNAAVIAFEAEKTTADSIIASELILLKNKFENDPMRQLNQHIRPIPYCEQCSDLELVLILERMLEIYTFEGINRRMYRRLYNDRIPDSITGAAYLTTMNETEIKLKLRDVEAQYTGKFNIPSPWWWICSAEERIRRLETAIKTNKGYPHYPVEDSVSYRMGKAMAAYEMWFKRPLPECTKASCSENERFMHAEQALYAGLPYLSKKEDAKLKKKLKAEYKKMFKVSIPEYWLSVARIYSYRRNVGGLHYTFATRTSSGGAVAKNVSWNGFGEVVDLLEFDMKDWANLMYDLDMSFVREWEKEELLYPNGWQHIEGKLTIFTLNSKNDDKGNYCVGNIEAHRINEYCRLRRSSQKPMPTIDNSGCDRLIPYMQWEGAMRVIDNMEKRIRENGKRSYD